jgi:hypothetical protein
MEQCLPTALAAAELFDPTTGSFSSTGNLRAARFSHTAMLLNNGMVLVAGGNSGPSPGGNDIATAELYDPTAGSFSSTGTMENARSGHTATSHGRNGARGRGHWKRRASRTLRSGHRQLHRNRQNGNRTHKSHRDAAQQRKGSRDRGRQPRDRYICLRGAVPVARWGFNQGETGPFRPGYFDPASVYSGYFCVAATLCCGGLR